LILPLLTKLVPGNKLSKSISRPSCFHKRVQRTRWARKPLGKSKFLDAMTDIIKCEAYLTTQDKCNSRRNWLFPANSVHNPVQ